MEKIKPMLCHDADEAFDNPDYIWETKYDGARIIARVGSGGTRLFSRSGLEKTHLFPELRIETRFPCILDGEVISGNSFNNIQHRINRQNGVELASRSFPSVFKVFDLLEVEPKDKRFNLQGTPLVSRKGVLEEILLPNETVHLVDFSGNGVALFKAIEEGGGEGVIGKNKLGLYSQGKREWLKVKTWQSGVFLAVGYTAGTGWRASTFGALVLARLEENGQLTHVGEVGTGFDQADIRSLHSMFTPLSRCPFSQEMPATWIKPFAIRVRYLEYTKDMKLRFPSFRGVA